MDRKEFESMAPTLRDSIVGMVRRLVPQDESSITADDVAQDTLLRLWTLRDRLDSYRSIEALAMVIARNRVIDLMRHERPDRTISIDGYDSADSSPNPHEHMEHRETDSTLSDILANLPASQQALIRMRHIEGMEIDEIANTVGSSPGAIRVALSRARHHIKDLFLQQNG